MGTMVNLVKQVLNRTNPQESGLLAEADDLWEDEEDSKRKSGEDEWDSAQSFDSQEPVISIVRDSSELTSY